MLNYLIGLLTGIGLGSYFFYYLELLKIKRFFKSIEDKFLMVDKNQDELIFTKRVNDYLYFKWKNWEVIVVLDKNAIYLYENDICFATSTQIPKSNVPDKLILDIKNKWKYEIDDVVIVNNVKLSTYLVKNQIEQISQTFEQEINKMFNQQFTPEPDFDIDTILDKINKVGYNNLSNEEKEFLKNVSK